MTGLLDKAFANEDFSEAGEKDFMIEEDDVFKIDSAIKSDYMERVFGKSAIKVEKKSSEK